MFLKETKEIETNFKKEKKERKSLVEKEIFKLADPMIVQFY